MSYSVTLTPLNIASPSAKVLDLKNRRALTAFRLGFELIGDEAMNRYRKMMSIKMQPVDQRFELQIWRTVVPDVVDVEEFRDYSKPVPYQVLMHYEKARRSDAFEIFEIWEGEDYEFSMLIGVAHNYPDATNYYILAKWQSSSEQPITLDLIKEWIRQERYPKNALVVGSTEREVRESWKRICDLHDANVATQAV